MTQVAEVAVKSAFRKEQDCPLREAAGSIRSPVPTQIIRKKITAMSFVVFMGFPRRLMVSARTRLYMDKKDSPFRSQAHNSPILVQ